MKKKLGDFTLRELRQICDSNSNGNCELTCPLALCKTNVCILADNDVKKGLEEEIEYES